MKKAQLVDPESDLDHRHKQEVNGSKRPETTRWAKVKSDGEKNTSTSYFVVLVLRTRVVMCRNARGTEGRNDSFDSTPSDPLKDVGHCSTIYFEVRSSSS